jgi:hypothetical protein
MGWRGNAWRDEDIADILTGNESRGWEGVGANSLRPALPESFVEAWGYDNRVGAFQHYAQQGAKQNVVFIGDSPCERHREKRQYAPGVSSASFENLYEPIWVEGEGGKTVNPNNPYAWYVYNVVERYKDYVRFWEIKNEPDFTGTDCGWNRQSDCSWWKRDPSPAELPNWGAPIQSYIRMLRVSFEVIKSVDPKAYVCIGGIGYESFLDAVLRNTDNPDGGKVEERYPLKGGAWFDCLSFHIYPMYYLRVWEGGGWVDTRHSDAAAKALANQTLSYAELLKKYGYGIKYPAKEMIVTETNLPNKATPGEAMGSQQAQRNYLMKAAIVGQKLHIRGIYPFGVWDGKAQGDEGDAYDFMGFYERLPERPDMPVKVNASGIGWRTTSQWLGGRSYDEGETRRLVLPEGVEGGAFYSEAAKDYVYALWAKTTTDLSEEASLSFRFPASMNVQEITSTDWEGKQTLVLGDTLQLGGTPLFVQTK